MRARPEPAPAGAPACPLWWSWRRSVLDGYTAACLECYCARKCGLCSWPGRRVEHGVCVRCGADPVTLKAPVWHEAA